MSDGFWWKQITSKESLGLLLWFMTRGGEGVQNRPKKYERSLISPARWPLTGPTLYQWSIKHTFCTNTVTFFINITLCMHSIFFIINTCHMSCRNIYWLFLHSTIHACLSATRTRRPFSFIDCICNIFFVTSLARNLLLRPIHFHYPARLPPPGNSAVFCTFLICGTVVIFIYSIDCEVGGDWLAWT